MPFQPGYSPLEQRMEHLEREFVRLGQSGRNANQQAQGAGGSSPTGGGGGGGGTAPGAIPEAQVVFDDTGGHDHSVGNATAVPMSGDVTGNNQGSTVAKIQGGAITAAGAGNDKQFIRWNNGGLTYEYAFASTLSLLGNWCRPDISTLGGADAEIENAGSTAPTKTIAHVMPVAGQLTALSVRLSGDVGAAGSDLIVTVYKNGIATTLTLTITGAAGTEDKGQATVTPVTFAAGDLVTVQAKKNGAPAAVQAVVAVWGTFTA